MALRQPSPHAANPARVPIIILINIPFNQKLFLIVSLLTEKLSPNPKLE